ncbi:Zinc finger, RING/FYVE/PHD-type [Phytophthora cinnamomi]|uniref:Zinc finger, RING/FYVE/PHD-type n=1 Tax=Phytophthora cinnamomi TaxID=4785 RepID=UPI00355A1580|nr:Zinc finger, RING/FYVE/PHD-type [Phytophthora cinnamomi]
MLPSAGDKQAHSSSTGATSSGGAASPVVSPADAAGAALWANEGAQPSIMLPYVRDHADKMVARVRAEDPRKHYMAFKQVRDVCLYRRITQPQDALNAAMANASTSPLGGSLSSSFSSLNSTSRRGMSITGDPTTTSTADAAHVPGDYDFRGITRVPGCVDTVLDILASESARENYWVALNTMRDVKAAALLSNARLKSHSTSSSVTSETDGDTTAFPRWSRKYTAAKFSKHSAHVMDCCFAEYAARRTETTADGHPRQRGFVYRRSVAEHALSNASSVSAEPLAKARVQGATRFFIRDWLFDVVETQEPMVCKVALTCSVYVPTEPGRTPAMSRVEFRDFCTELLVGARRTLTHQWKDHAAHAGIRSSTSWRKETRCCSVCSAQFSLLRKRHTCRSCGSAVCSKCCVKNAPLATTNFTADGTRSGFGSSMFGPDDGLSTARAGGGTTRPRHLSTASMASMATALGYGGSTRGAAQQELEQEEIDQVHPDLEMRSTASVSGSRRNRSQRSVGSVGSQRSISGPDDDDDESDEDVRPYTPTLDLRATTSKLRTTSTDSSLSTRSAPGIVLLSDLETLTLSGSFHRATSMSSRASANLSATLAARSPVGVTSRLPAKSAAPTPAALRAEQLKQRHDRAVSEDNVLLFAAAKPRVGTKDGPQESSASTDEDEDVYSEDDLANFTLKLQESSE